MKNGKTTWKKLAKPKFTDVEPKILTHPNIPKPLHGTSPRTVMGDAWWDRERQEAYASKDYHCFACGVHKSRAWPKKWLEAHEDYTIHYPSGTVTLNRIVALCRACHAYIHTGRMTAMLHKNEMEWGMGQKIMNHGFDLLIAGKCYHSRSTDMCIKEDLIPTPENWISAVEAKERGFYFGPDWEIESIAPWDEWRLIIGDKEHRSKFSDFWEWDQHYNG